MKTSILIVFNEDSIEPRFENALGKLELVVVHELLTALKILKKRRFDICFIKVRLSKKDDFHLLKQIQKMDGLSDLLIAVEQNQIQKLMETLGNHWDYLVNPYSLNELELKLEKIIIKRNLVFSEK